MDAELKSFLKELHSRKDGITTSQGSEVFKNLISLEMLGYARRDRNDQWGDDVHFYITKDGVRKIENEFKGKAEAVKEKRWRWIQIAVPIIGALILTLIAYLLDKYC